jgi:HD superfamily phosphodiesterase
MKAQVSDLCTTTPTLEQARQLLEEASHLNPGPWVQRSIYVAEAAHAIAVRHPRLDPETALILGYLHDIGRRAGVSGMRHVIDGYTYLQSLGFDRAARICLTHLPHAFLPL